MGFTVKKIFGALEVQLFLHTVHFSMSLSHVDAVCKSIICHPDPNAFLLDIIQKYKSVNSWHFGKIISTIQNNRSILEKEKIILCLNQVCDPKCTLSLPSSSLNIHLFQYLKKRSEANAYKRNLQFDDPLLCTTNFIFWMYSLHDIFNLQLCIFSNKEQKVDDILREYKNKCLIVGTSLAAYENFLQQLFQHLLTIDLLPKIQKKLTLYTSNVRNIYFLYALRLSLYPIFNKNSIINVIDDYLFYQHTSSLSSSMPLPQALNSSSHETIARDLELIRHSSQLHTYPMDAHICCLTLLLRLFAFHEKKAEIIIEWVKITNVSMFLNENNYKVPFTIMQIRNQNMFHDLMRLFVSFLVTFCPVPHACELDLHSESKTNSNNVRYSQMEECKGVVNHTKKRKTMEHEPSKGSFVQPTDQIYLFEQSISQNVPYIKLLGGLIHLIWKETTAKSEYQSVYVSSTEIGPYFEGLKKFNNNKFRSLDTMPIQVSKVVLKNPNSLSIAFVETANGLLVTALNPKRLLSAQNASFYASWLKRKRSKILQKIGQVILQYLSVDDLFVYEKMDFSATYLQPYEKADVENVLSSFKEVYCKGKNCE